MPTATADGSVVKPLPQVAAVGYPVRPVATPQHLVMFVHGGDAYAVNADGRGPVQHVGAADRLFPADGGDVGLEVGAGLGATEPNIVEYVAADGTVPQPGTTNVVLPSGSTAVARLVDGLLILSPDGRLRLLSPSPTITLGPSRDVIGSFVATVAWTATTGCADDGINCPLHLTETARQADRLITPPPGFGGFTGGGGFSPDGSWLAGFVYAPTVTPDVQLVLIDTRSGQSRVIGPDLPVGEPIGSAAWSPDGQWLFFSGLSGPMYAQHVGAGGPIGATVALPLGASYSFTPL